ncbi:MAG: hypothetical protein HY909_21475 [Deltaproteobacteria bacterium]|nr:hypothetical protein [Deltaproteobacteria bacterium]
MARPLRPLRLPAALALLAACAPSPAARDAATPSDLGPELAALDAAADTTADAALADAAEVGCAVGPRAGERRVLGVVLDIGPYRNRCDEGALSAALFTGPQSLDAFYRASSYGRLRFVGDVYRVAVPDQEGDCDEPRLVAWAEDAERQLAARGVDLSRYVSLTYSLPTRPGMRCGLAVTQARAQPRVFNRDGARCDYPNVYWHENAHALVFPGTEVGGLGHAAALLADGGVMFNGDRASVTGSTMDGAPFSGPERYYAGWLADSNVTRVARSGEFTLRDLAETTPEPQLLRVASPSDHPDADALYVSWRRSREGFEAARPMDYDGVSVHRFTPCPSDFGTGRGGRQVHTLLVGVLRQPGDRASDQGTTVTLVGTSDRSATVRVARP